MAAGRVSRKGVLTRFEYTGHYPLLLRPFYLGIRNRLDDVDVTEGNADLYPGIYGRILSCPSSQLLSIF